MNPAIAVFGLGIGILVGIMGTGGGALMTPLLVLLFGVQAVLHRQARTASRSRAEPAPVGARE